MISASMLPNTISGRPSTYAVVYINLHSLDEHDKRAIGGLTENEMKDLHGEAHSSEEEELETQAQANEESTALRSAAMNQAMKSKKKQVVRRVFKKF